MKLMIVDDDDQIREGMAYGIQWENLGIDQVICCRNGKEALDFLTKEDVDLVITDISMPVLSGIDLMKTVREKREEVHFILISGYQEFEYAQAGVRYGADDYILKPIHIDELLETVTKVLQKIEQQHENQRNRSVQKKTEREQKLKQVIYGSIQAETEIRQILKVYCGFQRIDALVGVVVQTNAEKELSATARNIFYKNLTECLAGYTYTGCEMSDRNELFLVDIPDSALLILQMRKKIADMIKEVNRELETDYFFIGVSESGYPKDIPFLYECAKEVLEERWIKENDQSFLYQKMKVEETTISGEIWNEKILNLLQEAEWDELEKVLENLKEELKKMKKKDVQKYLRRSMYEIMYKTGKAGEIQKERPEPESAKTFSEAWGLWKNSLHELYREMDQEKKYGREVRQAIQYVRLHYMEKISMEDVAEKIELSSGYFGRIFKKQVGISFVKYLNQYRIDQAETLLRETNLKVYEVAEKVGISDYIYFSQVFHSLKGIAPTEIRKKQNF